MARDHAEVREKMGVEANAVQNVTVKWYVDFFGTPNYLLDAFDTIGI